MIKIIRIVMCALILLNPVLVLADDTVGVILGSQISTGNPANTYPAAVANQIKGGRHTVADITARNAITTERRTIGMEVFVAADGITYELIGGITNSNWQEQHPQVPTGWTDGGANVSTTTSTDNVGIGTSTPQEKLQVLGNVKADGIKTGTGTGNISATLGINFDSNQDGTTDFSLATNGNAGIGTWTPNAHLQVVGTVRATAFLGDGSGLTGIATASGWTDGGLNVYTSATTDNVGIGTTTPNATTVEIVKNAPQALLKISSSATGDGDYLTVTSQGGVGIGTTSPSALNANYIFLINKSFNGARTLALNNPNAGTGSQARFELKTSDSNGEVINFPTNYTTANWSGRTMLFGETGNGAAVGVATGNIKFFTGSTNERMTIEPTGFVGIGTTSPDTLLQVGSDAFVATDTPLISLGGGFSTTTPSPDKAKILMFANGTGSYGIGVSSLQLNYYVGASNVSHVFYQGSTELMRIMGNGNVGISTANPANRLSVGATSQFQVSAAGAIAASTGIATSGGYVQSGTAANTLTGTTTFSNATASALFTGGNVGIGTTNVDFGMLNVGSQEIVSGAIPTHINLGAGFSSTAGQNLKLKIYDAAGQDYGIGVSSGRMDYVVNATSDDHAFYAGTSLVATIKGSGNVGIGTSSPVGKFQVIPPTAQTLSAGGTISANACGTIKVLNSATAITTSTTNTFSAPAVTQSGCCMHLVNTNAADAITLDNNTNFKSAAAADVVLGPYDTVEVCSDGTAWFQVGSKGDN